MGSRSYFGRLGLIGGTICLTGAIAIAAFGSAAGLALPMRLAVLDERLPGVFRLHMAASGVGLLLLPATLLLRRAGAVHRALGTTTAAAFVIGAVCAIPSALLSEAKPLARAGFLAQAILGLTFLLAGLRAIKARRGADHRFWMTSAAAIFSGAIVLRLMLAGAMWLSLPFENSYTISAWASWLIPLAALWVWHSQPWGQRLDRGRR